MSLAEKLAIIRGAREPDSVFQGQAGWIRGVPRLGIPDLRFADGPPGVLVRHASTGMPSTLTMAATFSREEAAANGAVIGRDARALGIDVILEPYINMYRDPTFERAYNTLGEDPVLTGTLAAEFVVAAQAEGVMAQAKHFVAYEGAQDAIVDGQALREVYLAPFKAVVDAGVASVMCSYNRIGGNYSCGNEETLERILRSEYGFRGFVTSDWGATHGAEFIARGLDMEQPGTGPKAFFALEPEPDEQGMTQEEVKELVQIMTAGAPEEQRHPVPEPDVDEPPPPPGVSSKLGEALARGSVVDADIDRAVARVLGQIERFGWLDHPPRHALAPQNIEANARIIQRTAERGAVLLKNDGVLPLRSADLDSLALIGPGALQTFAIVTGAEQSYGRAERQVGAWHALKTMTKSNGLEVAVADDMTGVPIPASALTEVTRIDSDSKVPLAGEGIDFTRRSGRPLPAGTNARWSATLNAPVDGDYDIDLQLLGATGKFVVDGRYAGRMGWWGGHGDVVFPNRDNVVPTTDGLDNLRRLVKLTAGPHTLTVEVEADGSGDQVQVRLAWVTPADEGARVRASHRRSPQLQDRGGIRVEPQSAVLWLAWRSGPTDRGGGGREPEHNRRAQHGTGRGDALAQGRPRRARNVVHGRRRRLGRRESAHRQGEPRRSPAFHVAAALRRWARDRPGSSGSVVAGRGRAHAVCRRYPHRLSMVRPRADRPAVPVRSWALLHTL